MTAVAALQAAETAMDNLVGTLRNLASANSLLDRLDTAIPVSRMERAPKVKVAGTTIKTGLLPDGSGSPVIATAKTGDTGQYATRITFSPKQGFHCTCPDLTQRRIACKHVAALAVEVRKRLWAITDLLEADAERLAIRVNGLEDSAILLGTDARTTLTDSLRTLES